MSNRYQGGFITASYNGLKAPDAPTIGTATMVSSTAVSVTFTAPANVGGGAITGFTVISSPSGIIATGASSPITVSGLSTGTAYTFKVTATNSFGTGPASAASNSVTPVSYYNTDFYLVQAGGGGGGQYDGAGAGGAGGLVIYNNFTFTATSYSVSIGGGGPGSTAGINSTFAHGAGTSTATGGGRGGDNSQGGVILSGGSVGSAGANGGATGTVTQANPSGGGVGYGSQCGAQAYSPYRIAGAGGANAVGQNGSANANSSANGGAGLEWPASSSIYYGGGGGGGRHSSSGGFGTGGIGGGGNGGNTGNGFPGTANTGGGGGGTGIAGVGGIGGSGVIVISCPSTFTVSQSGLTMTTVTVGTKKVTTITAGTGTFILS